MKIKTITGAIALVAGAAYVLKTLWSLKQDMDSLKQICDIEYPDLDINLEE